MNQNIDRQIFAKALGIDQGTQDLEAAIDSTLREAGEKARKAVQEIRDEVDGIVGELFLPLSASLSVPEDQVATKSREVLERIAALVMKSMNMYHEAMQKLGVIVGQLPLDQQNDARQYALDVMGF